MAVSVTGKKMKLCPGLSSLKGFIQLVIAVTVITVTLHVIQLQCPCAREGGLKPGGSPLLSTVPPHQTNKGGRDSHDVISPPSCTRHVDTDTVHVTIMADRKSFMGMVTLANSIERNTDSDVMFHFVTLPADAHVLRRWIEGSRLANISYEIIELPRERLQGRFLVRSPRKDLANPMNFARVLLPELLPCVGRVIFIDADCLVLGDIRELYDFKMAENIVAAGVSECDWFPHLNTADKLLNFSHPQVQAVAIAEDTCMMNGGMYVADLLKWEQGNISQQLQHWMELNTREPVIKFSGFGSGTQAVLNVVLHDKFTRTPKEWNALSRAHRKARNPKLVHWNGPGKPWIRRTPPFSNKWMEFYVPDPEGRVKPRTRRYEERK